MAKQVITQLFFLQPVPEQQSDLQWTWSVNTITESVELMQGLVLKYFGKVSSVQESVQGHKSHSSNLTPFPFNV